MRVESAGLLPSADAAFGFYSYLRAAFKSQTVTNTEKMRESLGTDMLSELMNNNYARYYIELINRSCGGCNG